jgi:hypothetical protein
MEESDRLHASAALPPKKENPERSQYNGCLTSRTRYFEMEKNLLLLTGIEECLGYPVWDILIL